MLVIPSLLDALTGSDGSADPEEVDLRPTLSSITSLPLRNNGWTNQFHTGMHKVRLLLQTPSMRKCTYRPGRKIFGNGDRGSARITGAEQEKADMHAAYTSQFLFLRLLELSVQQHSQRKKKEQDLHLSSRHSARNTLLRQYFCNSLSTRACLSVPKKC